MTLVLRQIFMFQNGASVPTLLLLRRRQLEKIIMGSL